MLVEPVFRPPSEAGSLILQMTLGCSWNRCTYCGMYRSKSFEVRPFRDIVQEIREHRGIRQIRRVFLADGDALAAPFETVVRVLEEIRSNLPDVQRVGIYADSRSILKVGSERLNRLRTLGLGIIYFGPETGDEATLKSISKGATVERQLEASWAVTQSGIKLSMMVLLGLAGIEGSERHARATGRFITAASPTYAAALTVTPVPGTELYEAVQKKRIEIPDKWGMLRELQWMLEEMDGFRGPFHANHASNYLPLKLRLPRDRERAIGLIRNTLANRDETLLRPEAARGL